MPATQPAPPEVYAASCNPPRRAKRPRKEDMPDIPSPSGNKTLVSAPALSTTRAAIPILPKRNTGAVVASPEQSAPVTLSATHASQGVPPPAKRGRKPGPLSRSAREAQRKLNHSIIEKARRTKINDALATLRQMVPADYGRSPVEEDSDEEESYDEGGPKKQKAKPKGKREEKEKEFKLEILVKTVSYMQDLLKRVEELEGSARPCANCGQAASKKRKRNLSGEDEESDFYMSQHPSTHDGKRRLVDVSTSPRQPSSLIAAQPDPDNSRLPSISSWLPESPIDPRLLPTPKAVMHHNQSPSYLPSPPASTRFDPVRNSQVPPTLALGPIATSAMLPTSGSGSSRSPEDESAASLLLQIASSPPLRPTTTSSPPSDLVFQMPKLAAPRHLTPLTSLAQPVYQAQTPASLLGLTQRKK